MCRFRSKLVPRIMLVKVTRKHQLTTQSVNLLCIMNQQCLQYTTQLRPYFTNVHNNLDCLPLASLAECLLVRLDPTCVKHLSSAPLQGRLLTLTTNIKLGSKGMSRMKHSSLSRTYLNYRYSKFLLPWVIKDVQRFITLDHGPWCVCHPQPHL